MRCCPRSSTASTVIIDSNHLVFRHRRSNSHHLNVPRACLDSQSSTTSSTKRQIVHKKNKKKTAPVDPKTKSNPIEPYWLEFRRQIGRMEGLKGIPIPTDLQTRSAPGRLLFRSGAFFSDRLRYGRFLFIHINGRALLHGSLHSTLYSMHPPFVFSIVYLGSNGWVVSFDCPRIFDVDGTTGHEYRKDINGTAHGDGNATPPPPPSPPPSSSGPLAKYITADQKLASRLLLIQNQCKDLAIPLSSTTLSLHDPCYDPYISPYACFLSSEHAVHSIQKRSSAAAAAGGNDTDLGELDSLFKERAFRAFRGALTAHLDTLVMSRLDASPAALDRAAAAHAAYAAWSSQQYFLGQEELETSFGAAWMLRLRSLLLDDGYCASGSLNTMHPGAHGGKNSSARPMPSEYIYFNPRQIF